MARYSKNLVFDLSRFDKYTTSVWLSSFKLITTVVGPCPSRLLHCRQIDSVARHPISIGFYKFLNIPLWMLVDNNNLFRVFITTPSVQRLNIKFSMPSDSFIAVEDYSPLIKCAFNLKSKNWGDSRRHLKSLIWANDTPTKQN